MKRNKDVTLGEYAVILFSAIWIIVIIALVLFQFYRKTQLV